MSRITTHVLDTSRGRPAQGVAVLLSLDTMSGSLLEVGHGVTGADGRIRDLVPAGAMLSEGRYRITFSIGDYWKRDDIQTFFPEVTVVFDVREKGQDHHVPLLISPFGYSTYRGS